MPGEPPSVNHDGDTNRLTVSLVSGSTDSRGVNSDGVTIQGPEEPPALPTERRFSAPPEYEILGILGRGGMGIVYQARHTTLGRTVALKMILSGTHAGLAERQRFLAEAEAVAGLQHPQIVPLLAFGEHEGLPYFTLEFVPGGSLADQLKGTPQPPTEAAELIEKLARGVHHAHAHGIVHRDLKPANILLSEEGTPRITDFGLAKRIEVDSGLTATGAVLGTPSYMAPEQAEGETKHAGPAADVYSLGAVLYECLTGHPPFRAATTLETLFQVVNQDPVPVQQLQPRTPRDLATICHKCLDKSPQRRYATAEELANDLRRFLDGQPIQARPVSRLERLWKWARRNRTEATLALITALALLLLVGVGFWFSARMGVAQGELLAERAERARQAELAAAQTREAEQAQKLGATSHYFRVLNKIHERTLRGPAGWTETSLAELRQIATLVPGPEHLPELRGVAATCLSGVTLRKARTIQVGTACSALAFSPDGKTLALGQDLTQAINSCTVFLYDLPTGTITRKLSFLASIPWQLRQGTRDGIRSLAISPDGRWLVAGTKSGWLHRWDLHQENPTVVSWECHQDSISELTFSPEGRSLYSLARLDCIKRWEVKTWKESATFREGTVQGLLCSPHAEWLACVSDARLILLNNLSLQPQRPAGLPGGGVLALSPDGRCLFRAADRSLNMIDLATQETVAHFRLPGQEFAHLGRITTLSVSPDGALLASASEATDHLRLWDVANAQILADVYVGSGNGRVVFSPEGRTLAAMGERETVLYEVCGGLGTTTLALQPRPVRGAGWLRGQPILGCLSESVLRFHPTLATPIQFGDLTFRAVEPSGTAGNVPVSQYTTWLTGGASGYPAVVFTPNGRAAAWGTMEYTCYSEPGTARTGHTWITQRRPQILQFAPDGRFWQGTGSEVSVISVPDGQTVAKWSNDLSDKLTGRGSVRSLRVGQQRAAVGIRDGRIHLLDAREAKSIGACNPDRGAVQSLDFDSTEEWGVFGTEQGAVGLFRLNDGKVLSTHDAHHDSVETIAFVTPTLIASGSNDHTVRLWRVTANELEEVLRLTFTGPVFQVCATADGTHLAALVRGERAVRLWRLDHLHQELTRLGIAPGFVMPVQTPTDLDLGHWAAPSLPRWLRTGLVASAYDGAYFERLLHRRIDGVVDGDGMASDRIYRHSGNQFSVIWNGWLRPPVKGKYVLAIDHTHAARLWIDNKLVIDNYDPEKKAPREVTLELNGTIHEIQLDYRNDGFDPRCRLLWEPPPEVPGPRGLRVIPADVFFPRKTLAANARP